MVGEKRSESQRKGTPTKNVQEEDGYQNWRREDYRSFAVKTSSGGRKPFVKVGGARPTRDGPVRGAEMLESKNISQPISAQNQLCYSENSYRVA